MSSSINDTVNSNIIINSVVDSAEIQMPPEMLPDLAARFLGYLDTTPKTAEAYGRALRRFFRWTQNAGIRRPTRETVLEYRAALRAAGLAPATVQAYITALRIFFRWTETEELYPNIADRVRGAKIDREHKRDALTAEQARAVLAQIDRTTERGARDYALTALLLTGGLRTIEAARANVEDLEEAHGGPVLYIQGKGHEEKADYVRIPPGTAAALREYLATRGDTAGADPLFISFSNRDRGGRLSTRAVSGIIKTRLREAGIDSPRISAHSLRHTAVTLALKSGRPLDEVRQYARHRSIDTTLIYSHAIEKEKNECAAAIEAAIL